jgi:hypothetical protein
MGTIDRDAACTNCFYKFLREIERLGYILQTNGNFILRHQLAFRLIWPITRQGTLVVAGGAGHGKPSCPISHPMPAPKQVNVWACNELIPVSVIPVAPPWRTTTIRNNCNSTLQPVAGFIDINFPKMGNMRNPQAHIGMLVVQELVRREA